MNTHRAAQRVTCAAVTAALCLLTSVAVAQQADAPIVGDAVSGSAEAPAEDYLGHIGFYVRGDEVVFVFERALYEFASRGDTGERVAAAGVKFDDSSVVAVAGEFNDWSTDAWAMESVKPGVYELRKPLEEFGARDSWLFKYVVDGVLWIEPPSNASNAVPTGFGNDSFNLVFNLSEYEAARAGEQARGRGACSPSEAPPKAQAEAATANGDASAEDAPQGYEVTAPDVELVESPLLGRLDLPESQMLEGWGFKSVDSGIGAAPMPVVSNPMITSDKRVIGFVSVFVMPPTPEEEAEWEAEMSTIQPDAGMARVQELMAKRTATVRAAYVAIYESRAGGPETGVFALEFSEPLTPERREALAVEGPGGAVLVGEWVAAAVWTDDPDRSCMATVRAHVKDVLGK